MKCKFYCDEKKKPSKFQSNLKLIKHQFIVLRKCQTTFFPLYYLLNDMKMVYNQVNAYTLKQAFNILKFLLNDRFNSIN